ncbi:MAG: hypothetical protein K6A40_13190 [Solobacterium sp.]|nr:hypothetical protein [Solobacterium sp.]
MESRYGHPFFGDTILVITLPQEEAFRIQTECRHTPVLMRFRVSLPLSDMPDMILFKTEETWYSLRTMEFRSEHDCCSFRVYGMRSMFMADADLLSYSLREISAGEHVFRIYRKLS